MALETPSGRLPADGVSAELGRAAALWSSHHELLLDAIVTELPGSQDFATALGERSAVQFVLLTARGGTALWRCPAGKEGAARSFVRAVNEHAPEAAAARAEREAEAGRLEAELEAGSRDETVEAAAAALARAEADPAPKHAIDAARRHLDEARADSPALTEARRRLTELAKLLATPPEPL
jgi:hypothetical protein